MTYRNRNIALWDYYIDSVVQEAKDRNSGFIPDLASFIPLRRGTVGTLILILMAAADSEIPDEVYDHATMQRMLELIKDIVIVENVRCAQLVILYVRGQLTLHHRICTHSRRRTPLRNTTIFSRWSRRNITFLLCKKRSIGPLGRWREEYIDEFLKLSKERFWTDPALDETIKNFIYAIGFIATGHHCWCFESERYFGKKHEEVSESHTLELKGIKTKVIAWSSIE